MMRIEDMSRLEKLLSQYAAYHLNKKNIVTHFIGIPFIVFAIMCLAARLEVIVADYSITLTSILVLLLVLYYLSLDLIFGLIIGLLFILVYPSAVIIAEMSTTHWLTFSFATFVIGWIFQFIGHFYEKKKPAFMDDLIGLAIGPLFVMAEFIFMMGFRKSLKVKIQTEAKSLRQNMDAHHLK